ncbi:Chitinase 2 [Coemansia sp. IMI 209128]|nr:Chitinase 2 [Coemansia sp. IMI 209128]
MFLGGSSKYRPYDDAVLDGVDLDIESGEHTGYPAFINQLRTHFSAAPKQYLISATPQCVYPDANLGSTLSSSWMDSTYVQFYNNPCNLANINNRWNFDYASWDTLTKANANTKSRMYVGLPAGTGAAGNGYLDLPTLQANLMTLYTNYSTTFGGVMLWDASWYSNNKPYVLGLANWVKSNMRCSSVTSTSTTTPTPYSSSTIMSTLSPYSTASLPTLAPTLSYSTVGSPLPATSSAPSGYSTAL